MFKISKVAGFKIFSLLLITAFFLSGCTKTSAPPVGEELIVNNEGEQVAAVFPMANYVDGRTKKVFGQYVKDRFDGFHTGDDVEVAQNDKQVEVLAITPGKVIYKKWTAGYGGVVVLKHTISDDSYIVLYGHLRLSSIKKTVGDEVKTGEVIGYLGSPNSYDTDNERKHLHFSIYKLNDINVSGYVSSPNQLVNWINPTQFFVDLGLEAVPQADSSFARDNYNYTFDYQGGWSVEVLEARGAVNIFSMVGEGSARARSQIFIQDQVSEAVVPDAVETSVLQNGYEVTTYSEAARDENIEKPGWIITPHPVYIIKSSGSAKAYRIDVSPKLEQEIFTVFLQSLQLSQ